ncbi:MAG: hypothetical protein CME32_26030 [Gimesia sp.]|nr:hypothetical protein [Gimesia sp.]
MTFMELSQILQGSYRKDFRYGRRLFVPLWNCFPVSALTFLKFGIARGLGIVHDSLAKLLWAKFI